MQQVREVALLFAALGVVVVSLAYLIDALTGLGISMATSDEPDLVVRRCDSCGRGWKADSRRQGHVFALRLRRMVRHRAARSEISVPQWASPRGWTRCPSCLSSRVRTSGDPPTPEPWTRLEKAGVLVGLAGLAVIVGAAAGLVL